MKLRSSEEATRLAHSNTGRNLGFYAITEEAWTTVDVGGYLIAEQIAFCVEATWMFAIKLGPDCAVKRFQSYLPQTGITLTDLKIGSFDESVPSNSSVQPLVGGFSFGIGL